MGKIMRNKIEYGGGGGGNANEETVTWAEYNALTEEEKMNGTTYYVYDVNGDGQSFQPVIYSNEEKEIGVWTDGKPLYAKTLYVASGQINSTTFLNMPTQNDIERLVSYKGSVYDIDDQRCYALPYERITDTEGIWISCHVLSDHTLTPILFTRQSTTYNLSDIFVTLQYTKATDQPGSGTWTPQGIPACHYSTTEQVVGTWVDGKDVFEKTYTFQSLPSVSDWTPFDEDCGIDTLVDYSCMYTRSNGQIDNNPDLLRVAYNPPNALGDLCYYPGGIGATHITVRYTKSTT